MATNDPDDRKVKLMHLAQKLANTVNQIGRNDAYDLFVIELVRRYKLTEREQFMVVFRAGLLCENKVWKDEENEKSVK